MHTHALRCIGALIMCHIAVQPCRHRPSYQQAAAGYWSMPEITSLVCRHHVPVRRPERARGHSQLECHEPGPQPLARVLLLRPRSAELRSQDLAGELSFAVRWSASEFYVNCKTRLSMAADHEGAIACSEGFSLAHRHWAACISACLPGQLHLMQQWPCPKICPRGCWARPLHEHPCS